MQKLWQKQATHGFEYNLHTYNKQKKYSYLQQKKGFLNIVYLDQISLSLFK